LFESDFPYDTQNELNFNLIDAGMISVGLTVEG
jgi:hypothetical protein